MNITQEIFATKMLFALVISAVLKLLPLVAFKTVSFCNNSK